MNSKELLKKGSEYDQVITKSHIADQSTASRGRATYKKSNWHSRPYQDDSKLERTQAMLKKT